MPEPSKHKQGRRRAEPVRRSIGVPPWLRVTPARVGAVVLVVALVLGLRLVLGGGDGEDDSEAQTPVGAALTTHSEDWKTKDGSSYRLTITPFAEPVSAGAPSGCVTAPGAGRTNLRFTVRIDNKGSQPAPVPALRFAATMKADGAVAASLPFAQASQRIDVVPSTARDCVAASRIARAADRPIPAGSATTFTGLIGGVRTPVGKGLALLVRFPQADAGAPSGSSEGEIRVPYPILRATR